MRIELNQIGAYSGNPASIIEMIITTDSSTMVETITLLDDTVPQQIINNLREIADELDEHNYKLR